MSVWRVSMLTGDEGRRPRRPARRDNQRCNEVEARQKAEELHNPDATGPWVTDVERAAGLKVER
jgi:hypothetical protein